MACVKYLRDWKIARSTLETLRLNLRPLWNHCITQNVACWNLIKFLQLSSHQQVQALQSAAGHVGYSRHGVRNWTLICQLRERQRLTGESEWETRADCRPKRVDYSEQKLEWKITGDKAKQIQVRQQALPPAAGRECTEWGMISWTRLNSWANL